MGDGMSVQLGEFKNWLCNFSLYSHAAPEITFANDCYHLFQFVSQGKNEMNVS